MCACTKPGPNPRTVPSPGYVYCEYVFNVQLLCSSEKPVLNVLTLGMRSVILMEKVCVQCSCVPVAGEKGCELPVEAEVKASRNRKAHWDNHTKARHSGNSMWFSKGRDNLSSKTFYIHPLNHTIKLTITSERPDVCDIKHTASPRKCTNTSGLSLQSPER